MTTKPAPTPHRSESPPGYDWAGARGHKWRDHVLDLERMLAPVNEPLIRALRLDAPYRIAEIGCGGGDTAIELLRRSPAASTVHGFDLSKALIDTAIARAANDTLVFRVADVAELRPPCEYDRLTSRFGVMFFGDPQAAFRRLAEWLVPGGRFAFAVWGPPAENPWATNVREAVAEVVELPPMDPTAPGTFRYADAPSFVRLLERAGFTGVHVESWRGTLPIGRALSVEDAARFALEAFAGYREVLMAAGDAAFHQAKGILADRLAPHGRDAAVRMGAHVHIVTGTRKEALDRRNAP